MSPLTHGLNYRSACDACLLSLLVTQIIMPDDVLRQIEIRLSQAVLLYSERLDWLTTDSRRLCGVVSEDCVCLLVDFHSSDNERRQMTLFTDMLECLLNEQVARLRRFNVFW